jgi:hypothetical protein
LAIHIFAGWHSLSWKEMKPVGLVKIRILHWMFPYV